MHKSVSLFLLKAVCKLGGNQLTFFLMIGGRSINHSTEKKYKMGLHLNLIYIKSCHENYVMKSFSTL